jgi:hypothetical protein
VEARRSTLGLPGRSRSTYCRVARQGLRSSVMTQQLCDLKKSLKSDLAEYLELVCKPKHICEKCGRVANDKKRLCQPIRIRSIKPK